MLRWVLLRWNFVSNYIVLWSYLIHRNSSPLKSEVMRLYITVKCDQPEIYIITLVYQYIPNTSTSTRVNSLKLLKYRIIWLHIYVLPYCDGKPCLLIRCLPYTIREPLLCLPTQSPANSCQRPRILGCLEVSIFWRVFLYIFFFCSQRID